jgi:hypothetical protein
VVLAQIVEETVDRWPAEAPRPLAVRRREADVDLRKIQGDVPDQKLSDGLIQVSQHPSPPGQPESGSTAGGIPAASPAVLA